MIKAVIVKNNKVRKIVVAQSLSAVALHSGESVHELNRALSVGDKFEGSWTRFLRAIWLK